MKTGSLKKFILFFILLFISTISHAQMPDWAFFTDRDGNRYYFDQQGRIHLPSYPGKPSLPVNPKSIDYHIHHGIELLRSGEKVEGVTILKTIISLPEHDNRVRKARGRAVKALAKLQKREGTRYSEIYRSASPLLYRNGNGLRVINEEMRYSLDVPVSAVLLKKKIRRRGRYTYFGITLGAGRPWQQVREEKSGVYRFLIAVDCERFPVDIGSIERAVENWRQKAGQKGFERKQVSQDRNHILYEFRSRDEPFYSGLEAVYLNGNYTLMIRLITPAESYISNSKAMMDVARGITIVGEH